MRNRFFHSPAKTPLFLRVVSLYVLVGCAAGIYFYVTPPVQAVQPKVAETVHVQIPSKPTKVPISGLPRRIELPRIGLVREVINGNYDETTGGWTLTDDKAQYAMITMPANDQTGQTLIYGHNTSAVLEPVRLVQPDDVLLVSTDTDRIFVYGYSHDRFVDPADTSVLYETPKKPRVVLMTCEGWFSEKRRLLYFDFKGIR